MGPAVFYLGMIAPRSREAPGRAGTSRRRPLMVGLTTRVLNELLNHVHIETLRRSGFTELRPASVGRQQAERGCEKARAGSAV
jgi:hypothetical protein